MASRDEQEAAIIRPPRRGEVRQFATTAATQVFAADPSWKGKKVRFIAVGDDVWVQTAADANIAITTTATDTIGAGPGFALPAANNAVTEKIVAGTFAEYDFFEVDAFVGFRGGSGGGYLVVRPAEVTASNV